MTITFRHLPEGVKAKISGSGEWFDAVPCQTCDKGNIVFPDDCPTCGDVGWLHPEELKTVPQNAVVCSECGGTGEDDDEDTDGICSYCDGDGWVEFTEEDKTQLLLDEAIQERMRGDNANFELIDSILNNCNISKEEFERIYAKHLGNMAAYYSDDIPY